MTCGSPSASAPRLPNSGRSARGALEQAFLLVDFQRGEAGGAGHADGPNRYSRGTARWRSRALHEGVVDALAARTRRPWGSRRWSCPWRMVIMSGTTPKYSAAKLAPSRPKPVITSSKISRMPCLSQISRRRCEIALRRDQHAGRAGDRLDDDRGDGGGIVQRHDALQLIGELDAPCSGWPRLKAFRARLMGVRQMIDAGQQAAEELAVGDDAADRDAAEADAVIAALAADQALTRALALAPGDRRCAILSAVSTDSEPELVKKTWSRSPGSRVGSAARPVRRRADGPSGRPARSPARPTCSLHRFDDPLAAVAGIDAPQARRAVEHLRGRRWSCNACPSRLTNRRGLLLNCRFAVKGIQNASRLFGLGSNGTRVTADIQSSSGDRRRAGRGAVAAGA